MNIADAQIVIDKETTDLIDTCPHCSAQVHIQRLWSDFHELPNRDLEFYIVFRCKPCRRLVLKTFLFEQNQFNSGQHLSLAGWTDKFPIATENGLATDDAACIPQHVLDDYHEGNKCMSINAYKASCAMFRRALQAALLELGVNPKLTLVQQINEINTLSKDIKDWAHQIRIFGNWGAHPDKDLLKDVDEDDAVEVHDFISQFLMFLFVMPDRVQKSRDRRQAKLEQTVENVEAAEN